MFSKGLDLGTKEFKALKFLNDVGVNGGIFEFREKIEKSGFLRISLISHLKNLFEFSEVEADNVITKFLGGVTYYEHENE